MLWRRQISTILVVEDETSIRKLVAINLSSRGYEVLQAANGEQALAQLRKQKPDLMVLDIKLPDITGWEVMDKIIVDPTFKANFPVLVMTASIVDAQVDLKPYPTVVEILVKPFKTEKLVSTIQRTLDKEQSKS